MKLLKAFTFVVGSIYKWEYWIVLVLVILSSVQSFFPCLKLSCFSFMLDFVIVAFVIFKFFLVFAFEPTYDGSHFPLRAENRIAIVRVGIALSFPFFSLRHCSMANQKLVLYAPARCNDQAWKVYWSYKADKLHKKCQMSFLYQLGFVWRC